MRQDEQKLLRRGEIRKKKNIKRERYWEGKKSREGDIKEGGYWKERIFRREDIEKGIYWEPERSEYWKEKKRRNWEETTLKGLYIEIEEHWKKRGRYRMQRTLVVEDKREEEIKREGHWENIERTLRGYWEGDTKREIYWKERTLRKEDIEKEGHCELKKLRGGDIERQVKRERYWVLGRENMERGKHWILRRKNTNRKKNREKRTLGEGDIERERYWCLKGEDVEKGTY